MITWLANLIAPLNTVLFHLGADAVTWAELLGFIFGGVCVWLCAKSSIHNFWTGILNAFFFLVLFSAARLWADAGLQIVYIVLGFLGWWQWLYGGEHRSRLIVTRARGRMLIVGAAFIVVATIGLTALLRDVHDVAPFLDALTTALSLVAQYLLNTKRVENWIFWIAADLIYIPLYFYKHLDLTGIVYVLFLATSIGGLRHWTRVYRNQTRDMTTGSLPTGSLPTAHPRRTTPNVAEQDAA